MAWVVDCDMTGTYEYHRRVLRLLQWHCPPHLWHLKTPVHMFALDALVAAYGRGGRLERGAAGADLIAAARTLEPRHSLP